MLLTDSLWKIKARERDVERTLDDNPDVIVLPEMWNTGYALDELNGLADKEGLDSQELLSHFARKHAVAIIGGSVAIEKDGNSTTRPTSTISLGT